MSSSTSVVAAARPPGSTCQGGRHQHPHQLRWWLLLELPAAPPRGTAIDVFINFNDGSGSTYQGPTINIFINFGGGHYRNSW
jgi:hypothetical protein